MRYMLLIWGHGSEADGATEAEPQIAADGLEDGEPCWAPWAREMEARGVVLHDGAQRRSPSSNPRLRQFRPAAIRHATLPVETGDIPCGLAGHAA